MFADTLVAYRLSHQAPHTRPLFTDPRILYHDLSPHPALSPVPGSNEVTDEEQRQNESSYRQLLVQGSLAILLPTEDLENACLRTLVADVIAEVILGNFIGNKACEGWFIWTTINNLINAVKIRVHPQTTGETIKTDTKSRLEKFGLLAGKHERTTTSTRPYEKGTSFSTVFWRTLQLCYLAFISIRFVLVGFVAASSQPLRSSTVPRATIRHETSPMEKAATTASREQVRPLSRYRIFSLVSCLLDLSTRSPWLYGSVTLFRHHLVEGAVRIADTDGIIDQ